MIQSASKHAGGALVDQPEVGGTFRVQALDMEIHSCLDRLEAVLGDEAKALEALSPEALRSINARKSVLLLELDRGQRTYKLSLSPATVERLRDIGTKLTQNMQRLSLHVAALNEVLGVVRRSVERSEADGTYSRTTPVDAWIK